MPDIDTGSPAGAKYPEYKSSDLCEGCISLSNVEGSPNGLLYLSDIILTQ